MDNNRRNQMTFKEFIEITLKQFMPPPRKEPKMKTLADTNGFRIQCTCGQQTQTYTQIGAAQEAHNEHKELEHE